MEDKITLPARVPVVALADVERFIESAQHLKALTQQLHALRMRESRRQHVLAQQISTFTNLCGQLAEASPRLADLWTQTQSELNQLTEGAPVPAPPAAAAHPGRPAAPCVNGSATGRASAIGAGRVSG